MDLDNYEFQSNFARKFYGRGLRKGAAQGKAEGRIEIILKMLATRFGASSEAIEARVRKIDNAELDEVAERLLTAETVEEALGMVAA